MSPSINGQEEITNAQIESILAKTIHLHKKDWANRLPKVVWACQTT